MKGLSLQYLNKHLRLTIVLVIIKLELQVEITYRNFLTEQKASSIFSFLFLSRTTLETPRTRLQLKFIHLSKYKFCHKFKDCVSPMCNCGIEMETIKHFFLALPKSLLRPLSDRSLNYKFW